MSTQFKAGPPIPGPYRAEGRTVKAVSHGRWFSVARVDNPRFTEEAKERTAKFLATAPELLKALQDLASCGVQDHDDNPMARTCSTEDPQDCALCAARAVIAKAEAASS